MLRSLLALLFENQMTGDESLKKLPLKVFSKFDENRGTVFRKAIIFSDLHVPSGCGTGMGQTWDKRIPESDNPNRYKV